MSKRRQWYAPVTPDEPPPPAPLPVVPPPAPRGRRYGIHATQGSRLKGRYKVWRRLRRERG